MHVRKPIGIRIGSVVMLGILAGVFTANILCNLAHVIDKMGVEHSHPYGHDHHHGSSSAVVEHDHKDKGHDHDNNSEKDCCNESVPVFFAALSNTTIPVGGIKIILPSTDLFTQLNKSPANLGLMIQRKDYLNKAPPLIVSDLRVLFHSFLV